MATQSPDGAGRSVRAVDGLLHTGDQNRVRTAFDEGVEAVRQQQPGDGLELDGFAEIAEPVVRVELGGVDPPPGDGRVEAEVTGSRGDRRQQIHDVLAQSVDVAGVRGVVDGDTPGTHVLGLEHGLQLVESPRAAGDDRGRRTVDRGDLDIAAPPPQTRPHLVHRQPDRHHPAPPGQGPDRLTAQRHHTRRVLQRQNPRHIRGSDLPLRMPHDRIRAHPVRLPQRRQRHHHREQRRLHHIHPRQQHTTVIAQQHIQQIPLHEGGQRLRALLETGPEHRSTRIQLPRHRTPLRTLPRKHQHRPAGPGDPRHHAIARSTLREGTQPHQQLLTRGTQHHATPLERGTGRQRRRHVLQRHPGISGGLGDPPRVGPQRLLTPRRQHPPDRPRLLRERHRPRRQDGPRRRDGLLRQDGLRRRDGLRRQ
ncbi:hypothetical protein Save01_09179 [Streptomyces avermitilis]